MLIPALVFCCAGTHPLSTAARLRKMRPSRVLMPSCRTRINRSALVIESHQQQVQFVWNRISPASHAAQACPMYSKGYVGKRDIHALFTIRDSVMRQGRLAELSFLMRRHSMLSADCLGHDGG